MCELPAVGQRLAELCNTLALVGAPPNACRGRGQRVGKGFSVVALFLAYPFKNGAYSVLENTIDTVFWSFPINFPSWGAVAPVSSGCLFTAVISLGPLSKLHFPAPIPLFTYRYTTQPGVQWAQTLVCTDCVFSSSFVLPSTDWVLCSPVIPQIFLPAPADSPAVSGLF